MVTGSLDVKTLLTSWLIDSWRVLQQVKIQNVNIQILCGHNIFYECLLTYEGHFVIILYTVHSVYYSPLSYQNIQMDKKCAHSDPTKCRKNILMDKIILKSSHYQTHMHWCTFALKQTGSQPFGYVRFWFTFYYKTFCPSLGVAAVVAGFNASPWTV